MRSSGSLLLILLCCIAAVSFAQPKNGTIKIKKKEEEEPDLPKLDTTDKHKHPYLFYTSNTLFYGYQHIGFKNLNAALFPNGESFTPEQLIYGVFGSQFVATNRTSWAKTSMLCYTRISPQKKCDDLNSSWTLSGFKLHVETIGRDLFQQAKWIDLTLYLGCEYGRLRLDYENADGTVYRYKDPYFAVNGMSELCFNIGKRRGLAFGARAGYDYDLGNPRWIGIKGPGPHLPGTQLRGQYYSAFLGYRFY